MMSHITIILKRSAMADALLAEASYEYELPVPHGSTPQQVGELVRKAYKRLEADHED
jgi:hypothetical protein